MPSQNAQKQSGENELSFIDHLEELRIRIIRALLALLAGFIVMYFFAEDILSFLIAPFNLSTSSHLTLLAPLEGFMVNIKVAFIGGAVAASPVIFYQFWKFLAPALYENERKVIFPVVFWSVFLFAVGAAFAYWMLPLAMKFFQSFGADYAENMWSLSKYINLVTFLLFAFGLVFELPLILYYAARMGLVTPEFLRKKRKHAIIILLIIAAVVTPPDVMTQIILSVPLITLYEISILLSGIAAKKHRREKAKSAN